MNLFDFLLLCCKAIVKFFKNLVVVLLQMIRLGLQYFWIVIPFAVLGFFAGWLWVKPFATTYKGNATIMYTEGMREVVQEGLFDFLNLTLEEKCEYGMTVEAMGAFDRLNIYNIIDSQADSIADYVDRDRSVGYSDTLDLIMRDRVHLEIKMLGCSDFKPFETALFNFFNSQDYLLQADKRCKQIQNQRLDYYSKEVARLDSFSSYDYFVRPRHLKFGVDKDYEFSTVQDLYYDDIMLVMNQKSYLEMQQLSTPNVINFQTPFVVYAMPPGYKYLIGLCVGTLMGLLLSLGVKYRKEVFVFLKER